MPFLARCAAVMADLSRPMPRLARTTPRCFSRRAAAVCAMPISAAIERMLHFRLDHRKVVHDAWIKTPAKRASAAISAIINMSLVPSVGVVRSRRHQISRNMRGAAHLQKATIALHAAKID